MLHATPSLWREYCFSVPQKAGGEWSGADQEAWLAAKLRQMRRVSSEVESLAVEDTAGVDVMPEVLLSLTASCLTCIHTASHPQPVLGSAMRALAGLTRLEDAEIGSTSHALPTNCGWAVGQLTALRWLTLSSRRFPADLSAGLAHLSRLEYLNLTSLEHLPNVQPLTALGQLEELILAESQASPCLALLPVAAMPKLKYAYYASPLLRVRARRLPYTPLPSPPSLHAALVSARSIPQPAPGLICAGW